MTTMTKNVCGWPRYPNCFIIQFLPSGKMSTLMAISDQLTGPEEDSTTFLQSEIARVCREDAEALVQGEAGDLRQKVAEMISYGEMMQDKSTKFVGKFVFKALSWIFRCKVIILDMSSKNPQHATFQKNIHPGTTPLYFTWDKDRSMFGSFRIASNLKGPAFVEEYKDRYNVLSYRSAIPSGEIRQRPPPPQGPAVVDVVAPLRPPVLMSEASKVTVQQRRASQIDEGSGTANENVSIGDRDDVQSILADAPADLAVSLVETSAPLALSPTKKQRTSQAEVDQDSSADLTAEPPVTPAPAEEESKYRFGARHKEVVAHFENNTARCFPCAATMLAPHNNRATDQITATSVTADPKCRNKYDSQRLDGKKPRKFLALLMHEYTAREKEFLLGRLADGSDDDKALFFKTFYGTLLPRPYGSDECDAATAAQLYRRAAESLRLTIRFHTYQSDINASRQAEKLASWAGHGEVEKFKSDFVRSLTSNNLDDNKVFVINSVSFNGSRCTGRKASYLVQPTWSVPACTITLALSAQRLAAVNIAYPPSSKRYGFDSARSATNTLSISAVTSEGTNFAAKDFYEEVTVKLIPAAMGFLRTSRALVLTDQAISVTANNHEWVQRVEQLTGSITPLLFPSLGADRSKYLNATYRRSLGDNILTQVLFQLAQKDENSGSRAQLLVDALVEVMSAINFAPANGTEIVKCWKATTLMGDDGNFIR